ncbi:chloride channel protein [Pleionea litopenaei]|uniref:Chloride channel protein n=1 Tax=Pleionea litopenaei TaxID=3070815 RepID=A0AA51RWV5_9GAMM|nr:chloride channel protein [Pleionea sp. HL-JVS1]WMS89131.1 chloride channel protein [Pleionea sp. HL-JVS1]
MSFIDSLRLRLGSVDSLLLLALVGLASGILAGASNILFRLFTESGIVLWHPKTEAGDFEGLPWELRLGMPIIGGLLVGVFLQKLSKHRRSVGVGHVLERMAFHQGYLSLKNAFVQFFVGGLSLASGMSVGREGPGVHLGAASASWLGQKLKLPNNSIRTLVGCGSAAAISASFNTPLAGVIFAMEVIMMEYTISSFIPIILASVMGAVLSRMVFGHAVAFDVPSLELTSLWEMPYFLLMGVIIGCFASLFIASTTAVTRKTFHWPVWIKCSLSGVAVGLIAIGIPQVMGIGYDSVNASLHGEYGLMLLVLCLVAKFFATVACSGMSMPGGVIGPSFFMGAMAGAIIGFIGNLFFPEHASSYPFYAMVGMATMMSAVLQAPLAALMALLELTSNPGIILPGMFSVVVANLMVSQVFKQQSIFHSLMKAKGMEFKFNPLTQFLRRVAVAGAMDRSVAVHDRNIRLLDVAQILENQPRWILIREDNVPVYLMSGNDLARFMVELESREEPMPDSLDLLKIPAERQNVSAVYLQATLEEVLDSLERDNTDAAYVFRTTAPLTEKIYGVVTRKRLESYYTYKPIKKSS